MKFLSSIIASLRGATVQQTPPRSSQPPVEQMTRVQQRAEIHLLAQGLGLRERRDRSRYENCIDTFFEGKRTSAQLTDKEHGVFLSILRAWCKAKAVAEDGAAQHEVAIHADLTVVVNGSRFQLPRASHIGSLPNPFLPIAGRPGAKIRTMWPAHKDYFVAFVGGNELQIARRRVAY